MSKLSIHSIHSDMKQFLKIRLFYQFFVYLITITSQGDTRVSSASLSLSPQVPPDQGSFEGRVVVVCEKMMSQPCWASSTQLVHSKNSRGMTLLHLAAAQGYAGLIQTFIRWR